MLHKERQGSAIFIFAQFVINNVVYVVSTKSSANRIGYTCILITNFDALIIIYS